MRSCLRRRRRPARALALQATACAACATRTTCASTAGRCVHRCRFNACLSLVHLLSLHSCGEKAVPKLAAPCRALNSRTPFFTCSTHRTTATWGPRCRITHTGGQGLEGRLRRGAGDAGQEGVQRCLRPRLRQVCFGALSCTFPPCISNASVAQDIVFSWYLAALLLHNRSPACCSRPCSHWLLS